MFFLGVSGWCFFPCGIHSLVLMMNDRFLLVVSPFLSRCTFSPDAMAWMWRTGRMKCATKLEEKGGGMDGNVDIQI